MNSGPYARLRRVPRKKRIGYGAPGEVGGTAVRDVTGGQFTLIASRTRKLAAQSRAAAAFAQHPGPFAERRGVPRVLVVAALEPGNPVGSFVLAKRDYLALHVRMDATEFAILYGAPFENSASTPRMSGALRRSPVTVPTRYLSTEGTTLAPRVDRGQGDCAG
jgi:hypothetical protein